MGERESPQYAHDCSRRDYRRPDRRCDQDCVQPEPGPALRPERAGCAARRDLQVVPRAGVQQHDAHLRQRDADDRQPEPGAGEPARHGGRHGLSFRQGGPVRDALPVRHPQPDRHLPGQQLRDRPGHRAHHLLERRGQPHQLWRIGELLYQRPGRAFARPRVRRQLAGGQGPHRECDLHADRELPHASRLERHRPAERPADWPAEERCLARRHVVPGE